MTLADVGDKLGLSVSMVSRLERADRRLNLEVAAKLAQVYETNLDEIFRLYSSSRLFSKK